MLDKNANDGLHFTRYLAPKFLQHYDRFFEFPIVVMPEDYSYIP